LHTGSTPIADQSTTGAILMGECLVMALAIFAWDAARHCVSGFGSLEPR
jgi:hypothetical protein